MGRAKTQHCGFRDADGRPICGYRPVAEFSSPSAPYCRDHTRKYQENRLYSRESIAARLLADTPDCPLSVEDVAELLKPLGDLVLPPKRLSLVRDGLWRVLPTGWTVAELRRFVRSL